MPFSLREKLLKKPVSDAHDVTQEPPQYSANAESLPPPPSYESWMGVRENANEGLPPPPVMRQWESPAHNATGDEADRAWEWCRNTPLFPPQHFDTQIYLNIINGQSQLVPMDPTFDPYLPRIERSKFAEIVKSKHESYRSARSLTPLYSALHSRSADATHFVAYFEIKITKLQKKNGIVAIGFFAPPYPCFRLPGWNRASIGVHSDDGRRYVNDAYGGAEFTKPFAEGEVIGLGIDFELSREFINAENKEMVKVPCSEARAFMTRNGERRPDWEWDIKEEVDAQVDQPGGVEGLLGDRDLYAAVGVYGNAAAEVRFGKANCNWWPT